MSNSSIFSTLAMTHNFFLSTYVFVCPSFKLCSSGLKPAPLFFLDYLQFYLSGHWPGTLNFKKHFFLLPLFSYLLLFINIIIIIIAALQSVIYLLTFLISPYLFLYSLSFSIVAIPASFNSIIFSNSLLDLYSTSPPPPHTLCIYSFIFFKIHKFLSKFLLPL